MDLGGKGIMRAGLRVRGKGVMQDIMDSTCKFSSESRWGGFRG